MSEAAAPKRPARTRVSTARLGMWWFLGSEVAVFGGALTFFVLLRLSHPAWAVAAAHTELALGTVNTVVLLTSSLLVALAHHAAHAGLGRRAGSWLLGAAGLGAVFLGIKGLEWARLAAAGHGPASGLFFGFYYFLTGLHGLHVTVGVALLAFTGASVIRGRRLGWVSPLGLYWHFVDLVWICLYPLLYLAHR